MDVTGKNIAITEKDIVAKLNDREWRINNLYFIKDGTGKKVLFKMNPIQKILYDNLHTRNVIPKARKLGVCLGEGTRVLMANLQWRKIEEIDPGEEVVAFDENIYGGRGSYRAMRTAVIEAVNKKKEDSYRISFDDGTSVVCTAEHRWLTECNNGSYWKWRSIKGEGLGQKKARIVVGTKIRRIVNVWDNERTYEDGWFSGILDGEGSISNSKRMGFQVCISQTDGFVWNRIEKYLTENKFFFKNERDAIRHLKKGHKPINKAVVYRMDDAFRLLGKTQTSRFANRRWWEGRRFPNASVVTVTNIEFLGKRKVIDLQTSTGTFIAEGLASHNSSFFCIFALDHILFTENRTAGIIAHTQDAMKKMFRNTILFAVENMHPWLKSYIGKPDISTANELKFNNGGQIFVSLTTRGDTPNFLHISELGYISLHAPDKAAEVISGGVNSVTVDSKNMVSIESTADSGRMGPFYEICMGAERRRLAGEPLTALDFKIHFFPWWMDSQYELHGAEHVMLTRDQEDYFNNLEKEIGQKLSIEKKRWWVKTREVNGQNMFVQFPGTLTEAFSVSLEGAYFKHEMDAVHAENRIAFFPVDPMYPVTTAWDLGMSDSTAIVFFQSIGPEIRFVDYYENHGVGLEHYVKKIKEKGYSYNKHILPHDIQVKDLSTGISRLNFLWELGVRDTVVAPKVFISDTIEKVRILFPRFRFDKQKAGVISDSLQIYRKEFDDSHGVWLDKPWHGPESHCVDAIRTLATVWIEEFGDTGYVDAWGDPIKGGGVNITSFF